MTSLRMKWWAFAERNLARAWIVLVVLPLCLVVYWGFDREPPFEELKYHQPEPVRAGEELRIELDVDRDVERECSAEISRFFTDSQGYRTDYIPLQFLGADGIKKRETISAGKLRLRIKLPDTLPAGPATLNTETKYRCAWNPLHAWWPIIVSSSWPFTVLPPAVEKTIIIREKP